MVTQKEPQAFERTAKLNGLAIRSFGDLVALATLIAMLLSVVAWGLKLEAELNQARLTLTASTAAAAAQHDSLRQSIDREIAAVRDRVSALEALVSAGILPRTEERLNRNDERDAEVRRRIEVLENKINGRTN